MRFVEHFVVFCKEFNKFNKTRARMLGSISHVTPKLLQNYIFGVKTSIFSPSFMQHYN